MASTKDSAGTHLLDATRQLRKLMLEYGLETEPAEHTKILILEVEGVRRRLEQLPEAK